MQANKKYILLTSAYNEELLLEKTILSVLKQSILPEEWVIVDNGSTDGTSQIVSNYSNLYPWIKLAQKAKVDYGISGYHAVPNFYFGLDHIDVKDYTFLGNLDADIEIDRNDYYEYQINKMNEDPLIGVCTGITYYYNKEGNKQIVMHAPWHTTGGLKFYRRSCFEDIGGLVADMGWDGIDEMKAMSRGWKSTTFFELEVNHHGKLRDLSRQSHSLYWSNRGYSIYRRGYSVIFILTKIFSTIFHEGLSPAISLFKGFFKGFIKRDPKVMSKEEIRFLRNFQLKRLFS